VVERLREVMVRWADCETWKETTAFSVVEVQTMRCWMVWILRAQLFWWASQRVMLWI
jgi:hypothetical protein